MLHIFYISKMNMTCAATPKYSEVSIIRPPMVLAEVVLIVNRSH